MSTCDNDILPPEGEDSGEPLYPDRMEDYDLPPNHPNAPTDDPYYHDNRPEEYIPYEPNIPQRPDPFTDRELQDWKELYQSYSDFFGWMDFFSGIPGVGMLGDRSDSSADSIQSQLDQRLAGAVPGTTNLYFDGNPFNDPGVPVKSSPLPVPKPPYDPGTPEDPTPQAPPDSPLPCPKPTPLVIDMDGDGVELSAIGATRTWFDLNVDGAAEFTGWVSPDDAFLALDRNGNGIIDDNTELFGDAEGHANGFLHLAELDTNGDGAINAGDTSFTDLVVWQDANSDAATDDGELVSLTDAGITSVSLNSWSIDYENQGHEVTDRSTVSWSNGTQTFIEDVRFDVDARISRNILPDDFEYVEDALKLPRLFGFGTLASSRVAASLDPVLLDMAIDLLATLDTGDVSLFRLEFEAFAHRWAGIDDVPDSYGGSYVSGKALAFVEKLHGSNYDGLPSRINGALLQAQYDESIDRFASQFLAQSSMSSFRLDATLDPATMPFLAMVPLSWSMSSRTPTLSLEAYEDELGTFVSAVVSSTTAGTLDAANAAATLFLLRHELAEDEQVYVNAVIAALTNDGSTIASAISSEFVSLNTPEGTEGDDAVYASSSDNLISALGGDDTILAYGGNDVVYGGAGDDDILATTGNNVLYGGDGEDAVFGGDDGDFIFGGVGSDFLVGQDGLDSIFGGGGDDSIHASGGGLFDYSANYIEAGAGNDSVLLSHGKDIVYLGDGNDSVDGFYGENVIYGGDGEDTLKGGLLFGSLYGGNGNDVIIAGPDFEYVYGGEGDDHIDGQTESTEHHFVWAGGGNDVIQASDFGDGIAGDDGHDVINGNDGDDLIYGGTGNDTINGGADDDSIYAGAGDDVIVFSAGGDFVDGQSGFDTFDMSLFNLSIDLNLDTGKLSSQNFGAVLDVVNVENAIGNHSKNVILGESGSNSISGLEGDDELYGGAGSDSLFGGNGDDVVLGGADDDFLSGGDGNDTLSGDDGDDILVGGAGSDIYFGGAGSDTADYSSSTTGLTIDLASSVSSSGDAAGDTFVSIERIIGTSFADTITGTFVTNDTIFAGGGNDLLDGDDGNDFLNGDAGDDVIVGGSGDDLLTGGTGADTFRYYLNAGSDTITDFDPSSDLIDIRYTYVHYDDLLISASGPDTVIVFDSSVPSNGQITLSNVAPSSLDATNFLIRQVGTSGDDTLFGTEGDDELFGGDGDDYLSSFAGNDLIVGGSGSDTMIGGLGDDRYFFDDPGDWAYEAAGEGTDYAYGITSIVLTPNIEYVAAQGGIGTEFEFNVTGNDSDNWITGNAAGNTLAGGGGRDRLIGYEGDDTIVGGKGRDYLEGDFGAGGGGSDTFSFTSGDDQDVILDFEIARDVIDISSVEIAFVDVVIGSYSGGASISYDPGTVDPGIIWMPGIDHASLTFANFLTSANAHPVIQGTDGNDNLLGSIADDEIDGGLGNDSIWGGAGVDTMLGGQGNDRFFVEHVDDVVIEFANEGSDDLITTSVSYTLPDHVEDIGTDSYEAVDLTGNALANWMTGNDAANVLHGQDGADRLQGLEDSDVLVGGLGNDILEGGVNDGAVDTFVFMHGDGIDTILDFEIGVDRIDLSGTGLSFADIALVDTGSTIQVRYDLVDFSDIIVINGADSDSLSEDHFIFA
ncbi:MAG: calcium-binding protein [Pseudomonadota bacterium]